jgi:hypothetical protein
MDTPEVVINIFDEKINAINMGGVEISGRVSSTTDHERTAEIHLSGSFNKVIDLVIEGIDLHQIIIRSDPNIRKVKVNNNVINHFAVIGYGHSDNTIRIDLYFKDKLNVPKYITNCGSDRFRIFGVFCSGMLHCFVLAHVGSRFEHGHVSGSMVFAFMESILYNGRPFKYSGKTRAYHFRLSVDIGECELNFIHSSDGVSFTKAPKYQLNSIGTIEFKSVEIKSWDECPEAFDGGVSVKSAKK